ncbi:MAG: VIT1/CCC1 transporter family protein [Alphaproteobacteria bacterium]
MPDPQPPDPFQPDSRQLLGRWRSEKTAAYLSRAVAETEADPAKQTLFRALADAADAQASILARGLDRVPRYAPSLRTRLIARLTRQSGPAATRPLLAASKVRGLSVYATRPGARPGTGAGGHPTGDHGGRRYGGVASGALRAAVFGVNDGVVSNTALLMGVAGAQAGAAAIVISGVAGLVAGALSMAAGEYISMRTQREMFERQIAQEREELDLYPEEEAEELALIYHARGIDLDSARAFARQLIADPDAALATHVREELGLDPDQLGSPIRAALSSFTAFAVGAALPLAPFLAAPAGDAVPVAAGLAGAALFAVGAVLSLYSGRSALFGGLRMLLIGAAAAAATYGIGAALGVSIG